MPQPATGEELARLEAVVEKEPRNLQALIALGNLYFDSGQPAKAIDAYGRALAIDPRNPDVRTDLGIMYRAVKNYDKAVKEFREAARLDPKHKTAVQSGAGTSGRQEGLRRCDRCLGRIFCE